MLVLLQRTLSVINYFFTLILHFNLHLFVIVSPVFNLSPIMICPLPTPLALSWLGLSFPLRFFLDHCQNCVLHDLVAVKQNIHNQTVVNHCDQTHKQHNKISNRVPKTHNYSSLHILAQNIVANPQISKKSSQRKHNN